VAPPCAHPGAGGRHSGARCRRHSESNRLGTGQGRGTGGAGCGGERRCGLGTTDQGARELSRAAGHQDGVCRGQAGPPRLHSPRLRRSQRVGGRRCGYPVACAGQPGAHRGGRSEHPEPARAHAGPGPAGGDRRLRQALEVRRQCAAPPEPGPDADRAGLGELRTAAKPVRHRHAQRPALRASSPGLVGHRPVQAPPDGQRHGEEADGLHHGRADAAAFGVALSLHRVRCQYRHGVGQRGCTGRASSCWPRAPTARR
jgi:hypothetical protein